MGTGIYRWHGQFLSRDRACRALSELFGCAPAPGALAAAARKTAGLITPALKAITKHLISCARARHSPIWRPGSGSVWRPRGGT